LIILFCGKKQSEMSGSKIVLDTNVIIFASKQMIDVDAFLNTFDEFFVSIITFMEVYSYEFSNANEKKLIDAFFEGIEVIEVNRNIAEMAIEIRKNKQKRIKLPDAIILATAKFLKLPLLTDDWDDFQNVDDSVLVKKIDFLKI
jgi:predicted nucleic acid-binding protein